MLLSSTYHRGDRMKLTTFKQLCLSFSIVGLALYSIGCGTLPPGYTKGSIRGIGRFDVVDSNINGFGGKQAQGVVSSRMFMEIDGRVLNTTIPGDELVFDYPSNATGEITVIDKNVGFEFHGQIFWGGVYSQIEPAFAAKLRSNLTPAQVGRLNHSMQVTLDKVLAKHVAMDAIFSKAFVGYGLGTITGARLARGAQPLNAFFMTLTYKTTVATDGGPYGPIPAGSCIQFFLTEGDAGEYAAVAIAAKSRNCIQVQVGKL